jgi:hypothetical protein
MSREKPGTKRVRVFCHPIFLDPYFFNPDIFYKNGSVFESSSEKLDSPGWE